MWRARPWRRLSNYRFLSTEKRCTGVPQKRNGNFLLAATVYVFSGHLALLINHVIQKGTYVIAMYIGFSKNIICFSGHLTLFYVTCATYMFFFYLGCLAYSTKTKILREKVTILFTRTTALR